MALFAIDSFGSGFFVQSMLALWLYQRFGLSVATAAAILFWASVCSAVSFLIAVPVAKRFGLINTMVFTHLPSNVLLLLVPFSPGRDGKIRTPTTLGQRPGLRVIRHGRFCCTQTVESGQPTDAPTSNLTKRKLFPSSTPVKKRGKSVRAPENPKEVKAPEKLAGEMTQEELEVSTREEARAFFEQKKRKDWRQDWTP
jgi:hypothetical protein